MNKVISNTNIERFKPNAQFGLTDIQLASRQENGLTNSVKQKYSKSYVNILVNNFCTFFNLLGLIVFIAYLSVQASLANFMFIVFFAINLIGLGQQEPIRTTSLLAIWFEQSRKPPSAGMFSSPSTFTLKRSLKIGARSLWKNI